MHAAQPQPTTSPPISDHIRKEVARRLKRGDGFRISRSKRTYYLDGHVVAEYEIPATDGLRIHQVTLVPATHESRCDCDACVKYARRWCAARQMAVESERIVASRLNGEY